VEEILYGRGMRNQKQTTSYTDDYLNDQQWLKKLE